MLSCVLKSTFQNFKKKNPCKEKSMYSSITIEMDKTYN